MYNASCFTIKRTDSFPSSQERKGEKKKKEKNKRNLLFPLSPFLPPVAFNYDPQFPLSPRLIKFDQEEFREIVRPRDEKKSHDRTNSRESEASIAGSRGRSAEVVSMPCFIAIHKGDALITPVITFLTHAYLSNSWWERSVASVKHLSGRRRSWGAAWPHKID